MTNSLDLLVDEICACRECEMHLPLEPKPLFAAHSDAPILIIGQAPGLRAHRTGIAWNDPSGDRLRDWMGVTTEEFNDERKVAIVPMGFCYPGKGSSGDLPPRLECAHLWHDRLLAELSSVKLTLLVGQYAHNARLNGHRSVTETVRAWKSFRPTLVPLPHPSPRNNRWLKRNPWFTDEIVPYLQRRIRRLLGEL